MSFPNLKFDCISIPPDHLIIEVDGSYGLYITATQGDMSVGVLLKSEDALKLADAIIAHYRPESLIPEPEEIEVVTETDDIEDEFPLSKPTLPDHEAW